MDNTDNERVNDITGAKKCEHRTEITDNEHVSRYRCSAREKMERRNVLSLPILSALVVTVFNASALVLIIKNFAFWINFCN